MVAVASGRWCGQWRSQFFASRLPRTGGVPRYLYPTKEAYGHRSRGSITHMKQCKRADPDTVLLVFLQSTYDAAAKILGKWEDQKQM